MATSARFYFLPYNAGKRGAIRPGQPIVCRDRAEACRRAEKAMAGGKVIGAHTIKVVSDPDNGDYGEPEYLDKVGIVPELA
jgi:hypothetical protein